MNKKTIDKIDTFTLNYNYENLIKEIFNFKSLDLFINYIDNDADNLYLVDRLMEYCWYVFINDIIINKNKFFSFYENILKTKYNKKYKKEDLENIINDSIKKYMIEKNNINYHKIILESI
jgi:hypothetical protein